MADGASTFLAEISKDNRIVVFTARDKFFVEKWLINNGCEKFICEVTNIKKPAYLIIDDRCISFDGNFTTLKNKIKNFQPWYKKDDNF